jgi:hypothetical protein
MRWQTGCLTERAASSTAVLVCKGRAAADGRYAVGRFSDPVARKLLVLRLSRQPDPMAGEPWRSLWRPEHMRSMVSVNGFDVTSDSDLVTLSEGLALPPDNNGSLRNGRVAIAVRR